MADFTFLQNPLSKKWVISAPRRAKRPDVASGSEPVCPFCVGRENDEPELYRVPSITSTTGSTGTTGTTGREENARDTRGTPDTRDTLSPDWSVRVINNKFPFAPIHELIINSPEHQKSFGDFSQEQVITILQVYRQRYVTHQKKGQVYLFHNRGEAGGESLPHSHTQLAVVPQEVKMELSRLDPNATTTRALAAHGLYTQTAGFTHETTVETTHFYLFCPRSSQWPDEVWVAPKLRGRAFGEITDDEIADFAFVLTRLVQVMTLRHSQEFPFNFYIYPGGDWYLRLIPRLKRLGGFEIGTGIFVNTQDPAETIAFLQLHFHTPDAQKIVTEHKAEYHRGV